MVIWGWGFSHPGPWQGADEGLEESVPGGTAGAAWAGAADDGEARCTGEVGVAVCAAPGTEKSSKGNKTAAAAKCFRIMASM